MSFKEFISKRAKKFKQFSKRRWHSIPIGAVAIALVVSVVIGGTVFALTLISNTWSSPSVTVISRTPLVISSNLDVSGNFAKEAGVVIPLTITIHNPSALAYTGIKTHTSIYRTDGTDIKVGDVTLYDEWPVGTWRDITAGLSLVDDPILGWVLYIETSTADIGAGASDVTPLRVIFNTTGTYKATAHSEN
jgi:hypothetical protein